MSYELNYRQVEIPELDAFLAEYDALCRKHGMQFAVDDYDYDGGSYVTVGPIEAYSFCLNLDKADDKVTCIARARERVRAMRETEERASISLADKQ